MTSARGWLLAGGVIAPFVFAVCAVGAGLGLPGYSPVADHLSGLAAVPAERRWLMIAGFVVLGVGVALVGLAIGRIEGSGIVPAAFLVAGGAIGLLGLLPRDCVEVACADPSWHHRGHDLASVPAYVLAVVLPVLVAWQVTRLPASRRVATGVVVVTGVIVALFLLGPFDRVDGLLQRSALVPPLVWLAATTGRWATLLR